MLDQKTLIEALNNSFKNHFNIKEVKYGTFQIFLPYYHEDGDMIDIFVQSIGNKLLITDFGKTMMRLSYYMEDINSSTKTKIFNNILSSYNIEYNEGVFFIKIDKLENLFPAIMEFISASIKVSDIAYLKRETVKSLFYEYFESFITKDIAGKLNVEIKKDFVADEKDDYSVPYGIVDKVEKPLFFFPVLNDDKCKESIMTVLYYKSKKFENNSICVFEDFSKISPKNSGRLMDAVDRPFSNFEGNKEAMYEYTKHLIKT